MPKMATSAGVDSVLEEFLRSKPKRVFVWDQEKVVPRQLTRAEARKLLQGYQKSSEPVIVTSCFVGEDMEIRTVEWLSKMKAGEQGQGAAER